MASIALIGLKILGFGKNLAKWEGFRSWKFWAGLGVTVVLAWIIFTNIGLQRQNQEMALEQQAQEARYEQLLDKNGELQKVVARMQVGAVVDESLIVSNQQEMERLRKEHEERQRKIDAQVSSGPAGSATICAITGVCSR